MRWKLSYLNQQLGWNITVLFIRWIFHKTPKASKIEKSRQKKYDSYLQKCLRDGIQENPKIGIKNLTNIDHSNDEISVLELGLKHGVLIHPKEQEMIDIIEDVWQQIQNHGMLRNDHVSKARAKKALKSFAYNYLDLYVKQFIPSSRSTKTLQKLRNKCLKPDKGQGVVFLNR